MQITQIRNATLIIEIADAIILVDPMLADKGRIPSLKYLTRQRRKNPLVPLPGNTESLLEKVTHCLVTHCRKGHFDHLDRVAVKWLREKQIPVYCPSDDAAFLIEKGLQVISLSSTTRNPFHSGTISLIPCLHGKGLVGRLMAHGFGYILEILGEPTLYLMGDTLLTEDVERAISEYQPDVIVAPGGGARFDIGDDIIMGANDIITLAQNSSGRIIANHLEALDHCPVTRRDLGALVNKHNLQTKVLIPADGESLVF